MWETDGRGARLGWDTVWQYGWAVQVHVRYTQSGLLLVENSTPVLHVQKEWDSDLDD